MDSNCVNNYLGHALRAKCWHSSHIRGCQKRQAGKAWKSHGTQLIRSPHQAPAPQVLERQKGLEGSRLAWKCTEVVVAILVGIIQHLARAEWRTPPASQKPQKRAGETKGGAPVPTFIESLGRGQVHTESFYQLTLGGESLSLVLWWRVRKEGTVRRLSHK